MGTKRPQTARKTSAKAKTAAPTSPVTLSIPAEKQEQAKDYFSAHQPQLLSERLLVELITKDKDRGLALLELDKRIGTSSTLYEADLAELIRIRGIRQLVIVRTGSGWELQVLPLWRQQFLTLVSLRKEKRTYQGLDRLISTITKHGQLPPTLLIGEVT